MNHPHPADQAYRASVRKHHPNLRQDVSNATAPHSWMRAWQRALAAITSLLNSWSSRIAAWTATPTGHSQMSPSNSTPPKPGRLSPDELAVLNREAAAEEARAATEAPAETPTDDIAPFELTPNVDIVVAARPQLAILADAIAREMGQSTEVDVSFDELAQQYTDVDSADLRIALSFAILSGKVQEVPGTGRFTAYSTVKGWPL